MIFKNVCIEVEKENLEIAIKFLYDKGFYWRNLPYSYKNMLLYNKDIYYLIIENEKYITWMHKGENMTDYYDYKQIDFVTLLREEKLKRILK